MTSNPYRLLSWQELNKQLTCYWCSLVPLPLVSLTLFKSSNGKMKKRHCSIFDNIYCVFYGLEHEGNIPSLQQPACNYSCLWFYTHCLWIEMLWLGAMALAETELMLFAETRMMLWFGFLVTIVLLQCSAYSTLRTSLSPVLPLQQGGCRCTGSFLGKFWVFWTCGSWWQWQTTYPKSGMETSLLSFPVNYLKKANHC